MSDPSTEVARRPSIATIARTAFDAEQVNLIRATVAADCNDAELALFLETCIRHDLDPFIKEVWAIRWKSSGPVQTVVSKDGLLKVANRCTGPGWANQPGEFLGVTAGALHEHDLYDVDRQPRPDGTLQVFVTHKPRTAEGKPTFGGSDMAGRGALVGAWAVCRRRGHDDVFFEASRKEYDKRRNAWETHPHAMMVKVAESIVLRKAFPIAGVVGEGELDRAPVNVTATDDASGPEIAWPQDEELAEKLRERFRGLGYRRAKVRALVNACDSEEAYFELLAKLTGEAAERASSESDDIPDAEVVR